MSELAADRFALHHADLATGVRLSYLREGAGGHPLVLVHGYPETKRIWWRNVAPLAAAGFEVIVPDLRGFGDSGLADDGFYDTAAFSVDVHALVHDVLGHEACVVVGGDAGMAVVIDLGLRFPGFVERQVVFNGPVPVLREAYAAAGIPRDPDRHHRPQADYFLRQGTDPAGLAAELDTPERRRAYVADFYGHRLWGAPGAFSPEAVDFMTEPFGDAAKLRAAWGMYEVACGTRPPLAAPRLFEPSAVPTLVLHGPEDHVVPPSFPDRCTVAFPEAVGPFVVPGAGHFLQWERAELLNRTLTWFLGDLRRASAGQAGAR
ncbi:MAG TPA: alpha/beta hydrolase [Acidimicrobiales bacterium]|nr:alpha/beta hydrolase [Acidimicrobiales bacterium]